MSMHTSNNTNCLVTVLYSNKAVTINEPTAIHALHLYFTARRHQSVGERTKKAVFETEGMGAVYVRNDGISNVL